MVKPVTCPWIFGLLQAEAGAEAVGLRKDLAAVERKLAGLIDGKRSSTALLPLGRTDVLGRPGSGVFELSLWLTLPTTRRVSSGGSSC